VRKLSNRGSTVGQAVERAYAVCFFIAGIYLQVSLASLQIISNGGLKAGITFPSLNFEPERINRISSARSGLLLLWKIDKRSWQFQGA